MTKIRAKCDECRKKHTIQYTRIRCDPYLTFFLDQTCKIDMNLKQLQYLLVKNENDQLIIYETVCFGLYKERVHHFLGMQNNTFTQWIELESCSRKIREQQYLQEIKGNNVAVILAKKTNKSLDDVNVSVQQSVLDECSFNIHEQKEGLPKLDKTVKE